jgi:hypothetical protein
MARVFNEILTGKASNEPERIAPGPYRTESVPEVSLTCVDCGARYQAPVGTPVGRCGPCHIALVARNQAASNAALHESLAAIDERRRSHRWMRWALFAVAGCALAFLKVQMRKDLATAEPERRPYIYDPYIDQIRSFTGEMCSCADAACASTVRAKWMNWQRYAIQPTDSDVLAAASDATDQLMACFNKPR